MMYTKGTTLYDHQKTALDYLQSNDSFALFMEQGTGKTLPTLTHIAMLLRSGRISNALIVCPKAVKGSWERDIEKINPLIRRILQKHLTIVNYDLVWRRQEFIYQWDCIVLDESHYIKNRTSRRAKRVLKLAETAKYKYILTGTPIGNSHWEEIWSQFSFLDFKIFGKYKDFEKRYCILNQYYKPCDYKHVDEIREIIFSHSYIIRKVDCLDLPDKLPPERWELELMEKTRYKEMLKNYIAEFDIEAKNTLSRLVKLRQICSGNLIDEAGSIYKLKSEKPETLRLLLDGWDKKLVIFAEFKESIKDICAALSNRNFVVLDGAQKDKSIWRRFQDDPDIQIIVCQYRTASAGIDLFAADTILFYEPTLSSQVFEQACDRIHRPGQTNKCSYILFETEKTVEKSMWDALMKHRDFNEREFVRGEYH